MADGRVTRQGRSIMTPRKKKTGHRNRLRLLSLLVGVLASGWLAGRADEPPIFAITHARVLTGSGAALADATVVIADGLIQAVGPDVSVPPGAAVIDGRGLTVYPGFIDALTDVALGVPTPPQRPAAGPSGRAAAPPPGPIARGPEDRPATEPWRIAADMIRLDDERIASWREAGFTTVLATPSGGIFPGQASLLDLAGERPEQMVVRAQAALPLSFRPPGTFWSFPDSLMGVIAYIRQTLSDTRWAMQATALYEAQPRGVQRPVVDRTERTLAGVLERKEPVLVPANLDKEILRALRLIREWEVPGFLYGVQQGYAVADRLAAAHVPVLVNLNWPTRPADADPEARPSLAELRFRARAPTTPAELARRGVAFAFYSGGLKQPREIFAAVRRALEAGLPPEAALRAFTLGAAEILGVADRMGSIEPGKVANLVVATGDPFAEKTTVRVVFVEGRRFEVRPTSPPPTDTGRQP